MNTDQIKALKERADKATSLAREHELVGKCTDLEDMPGYLSAEALQFAKAGILSRIEREVEQLLAMCVPRNIGVLPAEPYEFEPDVSHDELENATPGVHSPSAIWKNYT